MSDILEPYMSNSNPTLEHHGILGMHWGHRKGKRYLVNDNYKSSSEKNRAIVGQAAATILGFVAAESIRTTAFNALGKYGHYKAAVIVAEAGDILVPATLALGTIVTLNTAATRVNKKSK